LAGVLLCTKSPFLDEAYACYSFPLALFFCFAIGACPPHISGPSWIAPLSRPVCTSSKSGCYFPRSQRVRSAPHPTSFFPQFSSPRSCPFFLFFTFPARPDAPTPPNYSCRHENMAHVEIDHVLMSTPRPNRPWQTETPLNASTRRGNGFSWRMKRRHAFSRRLTRS